MKFETTGKFLFVFVGFISRKVEVDEFTRPQWGKVASYKEMICNSNQRYKDGN